VVHLLLYGLLAIIVAAALFLLASRFLPAGEQIAPALRDEPPWELPAERVLTGDDVDGVRLPVALRGYRFAEVDILLERLAQELRRRDTEIATLRGEAPEAVGEPVPPEAYAAPERLAPPAVVLSKADDATGDDDG
jgi:DivIVA domain-containing protein